jgi:hypothetical protein
MGHVFKREEKRKSINFCCAGERDREENGKIKK